MVVGEDIVWSCVKAQVGGMNYIKLYDALVDAFRNQTLNPDEYTESHHIVPKHDGGDNSISNLVVVTYKQHRILHKVRYKAYKQKGDFLAYNLMYRIPCDKKIILCSIAGRIGGRKNVESGHIFRLGKKFGRENGLKNVESGQLDSIRLLANNKKQREHASKLGKLRHESGELLKILELAWEVTKGKKLSEEYKQKLSNLHKERMKDKNAIAKVRSAQRASCDAKVVAAELRSKQIVENVFALRDETLMQKKSSRSKVLFVSPEGFMFESVKFMAEFYSLTEWIVLQNWCKRSKYGWHTIPKPSVL